MASVQQGELRLSAGAPPLLQWILIAALTLGLFAFCLSAFCTFSSSCNFSSLYLYREDRWLLLVQTILLFGACIGLNNRERTLQLSPVALTAITLGLIALCYAGTKWVLLGFSFSRDEQMAVFDSQVFHSALLAQPLPGFWQAHAAALNTMFMQPVNHPATWISSYLPINAALRTAVGFVADPALTGPLMVALGLVSLWKCARLLWPDDREAAVVAALLYVGSGQVLLAGMTAYAMPAHLALNLLWLWFFLLNRRVADLAALLVAFVATGLHQPLFHPLFAAPILFTLFRERNWPRLALYASGYGAICAFWLVWPLWMHSLIAGPGSVTATSGTDYFSRLLLTLAEGSPARWSNTASNLVRFFAWQHALLLALMACGVAAWRRERFAASFAAAVILPVLVMLLILPSQANGFGYRYLHGVIGAAILLAVCGWRRFGHDQSWLRPVIVRTTLAGMIVLLPLQAWMAYNLYAPFARIDRQINASGDDYFITFFPYNLVINRPDLSNRPIRLLGEKVDNDLVLNICAPGARVALPAADLLRPIETYFFLPHSTATDVRLESLSSRLVAAGCKVDRLGGA